MAARRLRFSSPVNLSKDISPLRLYRYTTPTPVGELVLMVDEDGAVCFSNWTDCEEQAVCQLRRAYHPREILIENARTMIPKGERQEEKEEADVDARAYAVRQVRRYFSCPHSTAAGADIIPPARIRQEELHALLHSVPIRCPPSTPFTQAAWAALSEVRSGDITTYGKLAERCRRPRASRAVGRAMGENHVCIFLPCHRVVGASRALTGFGPGLWRKVWLLRHEQADIPEKCLRHADSVREKPLKRKRQ